MKRIEVFLPNIEAVKTFVDIVNKYPFSVNLVTDVYKIDAKSIMGIFSLDLSNPLTMEIETEDCEEFLSQIDSFLVK